MLPEDNVRGIYVTIIVESKNSEQTGSTSGRIALSDTIRRMLTGCWAWSIMIPGARAQSEFNAHVLDAAPVFAR